MYSVTNSFGLNGLRGFAVAVEADVSGGLPAFSIVGLPDSAVRESADRVRAAIKNLGFRFPDRRIPSSRPYAFSFIALRYCKWNPFPLGHHIFPSPSILKLTARNGSS